MDDGSAIATEASEIQSLLADMFDQITCIDPEDFDLTGFDPRIAEVFDSITTFRDAGIFCDNAGLVIRTQDGREFQLQIVRSK